MAADQCVPDDVRACGTSPPLLAEKVQLARRQRLHATQRSKRRIPASRTKRARDHHQRTVSEINDDHAPDLMGGPLLLSPRSGQVWLPQREMAGIRCQPATAGRLINSEGHDLAGRSIARALLSARGAGPERAPPSAQRLVGRGSGLVVVSRDSRFLWLASCCRARATLTFWHRATPRVVRDRQFAILGTRALQSSAMVAMGPGVAVRRPRLKGGRLPPTREPSAFGGRR